MESNDKLEQFLKQMYAKESAHNEDIDTSEIIDEEWAKFESKHFATKQRAWGWRQIAATIVGVLMLSGITYAAVNIVRGPSQKSQKQQATEMVAIDNAQSTMVKVQSSASDSIPQTRIFENVPLDELIKEIAIYYNKVADIQSKQSHKLRLYYKWNRNATLESVVNDLNHFDRVNLVIEDNKLIVKP